MWTLNRDGERMAGGCMREVGDGPMKKSIKRERGNWILWQEVRKSASDKKKEVREKDE